MQILSQTAVWFRNSNCKFQIYATYDCINPGTPYGTYMSHVFFLHLLHEYNKKKLF